MAMKVAHCYRDRINQTTNQELKAEQEKNEKLINEIKEIIMKTPPRINEILHMSKSEMQTEIENYAGRLTTLNRMSSDDIRKILLAMENE